MLQCHRVQEILTKAIEAQVDLPFYAQSEQEQPSARCQDAHRLLRGEVVLRTGPRCLTGGKGSQTGGLMPQVRLTPVKATITSVTIVEKACTTGPGECSQIVTWSVMTRVLSGLISTERNR